MDRLITMTTFLKVVKYANFTTAAEDLSISRTLVSRHVAEFLRLLAVVPGAFPVRPRLN